MERNWPIICELKSATLKKWPTIIASRRSSDNLSDTQIEDIPIAFYELELLRREILAYKEMHAQLKTIMNSIGQLVMRESRIYEYVRA